MLFFNLLNYFPKKISHEIEEYLKDIREKQIEEIRLRVEKPLILKFNNFEKVLNIIVTYADILETLGNICNNSIYAYQNEICSGFITVKGGHRVGITGNCVIENGNVINISYISSLNFRVAKQVLNCSNKILKYVLNIENNSIYNTLIVSPPGERENNNFKRLNKKHK